MVIERNSLIPLYKQVENLIIRNIRNNKWKKGSKIPSENEMVKEFKVSRGTVKKAISDLVDEGFLIQKQGMGTFVIDEDFSVPLAEGLHSFSEYMTDQGIEFETEILTKEIRFADEYLANKLNIEVGGGYLFIERIRRVNDEVIMFIQNNINYELCPDIINADFINQSLFSIIEENTDSRVSHSETRFAATEADEEKIKYFDIKIGSPLLFQEQVVYLENAKVIELGKVWLKSNRFYLGTILQRK